MSYNYFNYSIPKENNQSDKNIIDNDDKVDNDDDFNLNNLIFNNSNNKNSNSKSNLDNIDDNNDFGQFEPNNDYQNDNYNSIFSQFSIDKN